MNPLQLLKARRLQRLRNRTFVRALPSFVALLAVLIGAGQHPRRAIEAFSEAPLTGDLDELRGTIAPISQALALGSDFAESIHSLDQHGTDRNGPNRDGDAESNLFRVLDLLRRSEVDGVDLVTQLEFSVRDLRRDRAIALDTAAQRLTISLLFPLVVCILPAFVLLAIVPLLLDVFTQLPT